MPDVLQGLEGWQQQIFIRTNLTVALILVMGFAAAFYRRRTKKASAVLKTLGVYGLIWLLWVAQGVVVIAVDGSVLLSGVLVAGCGVLTFLGMRAGNRWLGVASPPKKKHRQTTHR